MLNIIIHKERRAAGENFLGFPYENHLKTLKIYIFYVILGGGGQMILWPPPFWSWWGLGPLAPPSYAPACELN